MSLIAICLSIILFLDCVFLVFLVLLQLPKKEAGAGTAFGGAATDALFGAGSGNVLTKITKYSAGIFFGLALILAMMTSQKVKSSGGALIEELKKGNPAAAIPQPLPEQAPANAPSSATPAASPLLDTSLLSNAPAAAPAPAPKAAAPPAGNH